MDRTDIGHDEEIGRAVIPLRDEPIGQLHHDFVPLISQHLNEANKNIGTVGFKFTLVDLSLVDHTRAELQRGNLLTRRATLAQHRLPLSSNHGDEVCDESVTGRCTNGTVNTRLVSQETSPSRSHG
uniref:Uncharacterized protein n=1 Tax=Lygus hesperus TaxID=30085 RepID=A0A0A9Y3W0_LYGHE